MKVFDTYPSKTLVICTIQGNSWGSLTFCPPIIALTIKGLFRIRKIRNLVKIMIFFLSDSNAKWWLNCVRPDALVFNLIIMILNNYQMALLLSDTNPFILSKNNDLLSFGFKNVKWWLNCVRTDKIVTNLIVMVLIIGVTFKRHSKQYSHTSYCDVLKLIQGGTFERRFTQKS